LSKVYYKNAADYFLSRGVTGSEDIAQIEIFEERIQRALQALPS